MTVRPEDLARTLIQRRKRQREEHARRAELLRAAVSDEVRRALEAGTIRRAWLIGSLASGMFGAGSDVDVVVEGAGDARADLWLRLVERLGVEVDLLDWEALSEPFRQKVLAEGVPLP